MYRSSKTSFYKHTFLHKHKIKEATTTKKSHKTSRLDMYGKCKLQPKESVIQKVWTGYQSREQTCKALIKLYFDVCLKENVIFNAGLALERHFRPELRKSG